MNKLVIERISHTGEGIGKINGKICFVPKTVVGDVVIVKNMSNYKKYMYADVESFVKKSSSRVKIDCPYYELCGGCQLMGMSYKKQLEYKKEKVANIFKKYGNMDISPDIVSGEQYKYRNKVILQVRDSKIGFYQNKSCRMVEVHECMLVSDKINSLIKLLWTINLKLVSKIMIREGSEGIILAFIGEIDRKEVTSLFKDKVTSIYVNDFCIMGDKSINEKLGKYKFRVTYDSFFQVNRVMTEKLYDKVLEYLGNRRSNVMDLYCGTGTIGIYVSSVCDNVFGIELSHAAVVDARWNKKINNIDNISFKRGDVGKLINSDVSYDAIIVDPPRAGLDDRTKEVMLEIGSDVIVYVSCNPITLVRDINFFRDKYDVKNVSLVDMFPNTYHVECVVLLEKKDRG